MVFNNYLITFKDKFFKIIEKINNYKAIIYIIFFIFYFLLYYSITIPQLAKDSRNNYIFNSINNINRKSWFIIMLSIINVLFLISLVTSLTYYMKYIDNINEIKQSNFIFIVIFISSILIYFNVTAYNKYLTIISNSIITKIIYKLVSTIFYILFIILFFYNINNAYNVEFFISLEILVLFLFEYIISTSVNLEKIKYQLKNDDFSTLTINCFNKTIREKYSGENNINDISQIIDISNKYGNTYLRTIDNIPIAFLNKNTNEYQDLILADFYYPGSYYSYLADSPLNGTPNLEALKLALVDFKVRIIHLDIYSDKKDPYDPKSLPIVKCENMKEGKSPLNFDDVLATINKWAWITDNPNNLSYPLFIYLNFNFSKENENLYFRIYESLLKYFSKYLVDKKYSFSGRNSTFPISMAKIKDCLGKIIIITNSYPTKTVLDELINASTNKLNNIVTLNEYKQSYITFDKIGLSQDNNKIDLLNNSKSNLSFYYTNPNVDYKNDNQSKAGLFNPSFQDCAQYGIQSTLMYLFVPDDNLNKWNLFFKNKNNLDPVLKDESLRLVSKQQTQIEQQNPLIGLQEPQKYCVVNGLISTQKSNLSDSLTNSSCK
jgi:hypothetical protein